MLRRRQFKRERVSFALQFKSNRIHDGEEDGAVISQLKKLNDDRIFNLNHEAESTNRKQCEVLISKPALGDSATPGRQCHLPKQNH